MGTGSVDGEEIAELYEYDPDNDSWIERADFPGELRSAATGFAVNGKGYIGGGVNADFTGTHTDFFEYDPSNDTWKKADGMDFPIPNTAWSTAFVHNSTVYWGTGARLAGGVRPTPRWHKISLYTPPSFVGAEITNTTCEGGQDGSIDVEIAGGIPPFQYSWSHGAATEDVNNLSQGEYQLEVTDAEGTTITSPVYMVEADYYVEIENVDQTTEACDKRDGSITIEAVTNANSLLYDWSHEDSLKEMTATGLKAGKYTVTVTNEHGCIDTVATEVKATSGPVVVQDQVIQPDCKGTDYGQISIRIQGGHGVTSISWTGPDDFRSDEGEITDLTTGTYVVKLEDERGCMDSMSFSISEPEYPEGTVEVIPSGGGMSLGQILVSDVQGGVPPYQYVLYNEINNVVERNASGQFDSLNHGIYAVEIIDDDSCSTIYPDLSIILTNTGSIEENLSFAFSPNPASDHIRVNMNVPKNSSARVQIIDLLGKVVHDQFIGVGKSEVGIDIRDLSKGTYFIQLTAGEKRHVMALVK
ncbi:MAG: T9SS type A sorting domain-containing protein [Saprospiraceae bacterium]|nr:T9SS type A sorting domain-containing protein [Saprospiraceae bacterium]